MYDKQLNNSDLICLNTYEYVCIGITDPSFRSLYAVGWYSFIKNKCQNKPEML